MHGTDLLKFAPRLKRNRTVTMGDPGMRSGKCAHVVVMHDLVDL